MRKFMMAAVFLLMAAVSVPAYAQKSIIIEGDAPSITSKLDVFHFGDFGSNIFYFDDDLYDELDMTNDQLRSIRKIQRKYKKQRINLNADLEVLNMDLKDLYEDLSKNQKEIELSLKKYYDLKLQTRIADLNQKIEIEKVLTKEQLKTLDEIYREKYPFGNISILSTGDKARLYYKAEDIMRKNRKRR